MTSKAENYSGGYSPLIIAQFKQRTFAKQGVILLPYLTSGLTWITASGSMTILPNNSAPVLYMVLTAVQLKLNWLCSFIINGKFITPALQQILRINCPILMSNSIWFLPMPCCITYAILNSRWLSFGEF